MIQEINNIDEMNKLLNNSNFNINDNNPYRFCLAIENKAILTYFKIYEKIEIEYLYVNDMYRKQGLASLLLDNLIHKYNDIVNITLEVKESNIIARQLYKNFLFKEVAIRKNYYGNEDGILMLREFDVNGN